MELYKLCENVYYTDYEQRRDRPRLGYIKGKNFSLAIDAGHSDSHVQEFYELLKKNDLPLPQLTIITHWHRDHSFGMHAINGQSIACKETNDHLREFIAQQNPQSDQEMLKNDDQMRYEYGDKPIIVKTSDLEYENKLIIDLGDINIEILKAPSPHTDDASIVYLPQQKAVFIGDGSSGRIPDWYVDPIKGQEMIEFFNKLDFNFSVGCHWAIENKEELIETLKREYH